MKVRESAVRVKAVYLAIGITMNGEKEVLGLWLAQTEGAKFWLQVVTELRNRGVQDIFIACVDGLKGFADAIEAVFPKAVVQLCIVHMVRHSLNYVSWKRRPEVAADLRHIVLRLPAGNPQGHLHHQRHRVGEHEPEEADQESGFIPQRRGADQAVLSDPAKHQPEVNHAHPGLEGCTDPLYHSVWRSHLRLKSPRIPEPVRSRGWGTV